MTFSQSGHSIIAPGGFQACMCSLKKIQDVTECQSAITAKEKKKAFQEFRIHETLANSDMSCTVNNKRSQDTCCVQNTVLLPVIKLNPLYLSIRDYPTCVLWKHKSVYLSGHSIPSYYSR